MSNVEHAGGSRFIRGEQPGGFGAKMMWDPAGTMIAHITTDLSKEGPPGHVHGGALATMLDEVMGAAAWASGYKVLAANLNINFKLPVPLSVPLVVRGWVDRQEGRKVFALSELLLPDGKVATSGSGLFIESPEIFGDYDYKNLFASDRTETD